MFFAILLSIILINGILKNASLVIASLIHGIQSNTSVINVMLMSVILSSFCQVSFLWMSFFFITFCGVTFCSVLFLFVVIMLNGLVYCELGFWNLKSKSTIKKVLRGLPGLKTILNMNNQCIEFNIWKDLKLISICIDFILHKGRFCKGIYTCNSMFF